MDPNNYPEPTTLKTHIFEFIQSFVIFAAIGTVIYLFAVQPHKVSGCSMCPTFHTGDYILTDKVTYHFQTPQHGDVIVFKNPLNTSEDFIKRVIAVPGDKLKVQDGHVYLNGKQLNEPYLEQTVITSAGAFLSDGEEITVKPTNYVVFGDNRPGSSDSRAWGYLPINDIIGKAIFRYWPQNVIGIIPSGSTYYK